MKRDYHDATIFFARGKLAWKLLNNPLGKPGHALKMIKQRAQTPVAIMKIVIYPITFLNI
jgi:hypothetical protein